MEIKALPLFFNRLDVRNTNPDLVSREFEALLLEQFLKVGMEPFLENKSFTTQMYWEQFISVVADEMAKKDPLKLNQIFENQLKAYKENT
ncbi:MAG: hypothetical protein GXN97_02275 [Aquificae bacterium]|nr:hypothetical protein [Aquificota bacterium]